MNLVGARHVRVSVGAARRNVEYVELCQVYL